MGRSRLLGYFCFGLVVTSSAIAASGDSPFGDGLWQREIEGAQSGGVCSAKGTVSLFENGVELACGTLDAGCEKTSNVSVQKTGDDSFYFTVRVPGSNRVLYRQKAVRSPDKLKVMLGKIEDFDSRGRSDSAEAKLNETQRSTFHKCQNISFAEWRAEQRSATALRQSRDAERKRQSLEQKRQELAQSASQCQNEELKVAALNACIMRVKAWTEYYSAVRSGKASGDILDDIAKKRETISEETKDSITKLRLHMVSCPSGTDLYLMADKNGTNIWNEALRKEITINSPQDVVTECIKRNS